MKYKLITSRRKFTYLLYFLVLNYSVAIAQQPDSSVADSTLLKQIEGQLQSEPVTTQVRGSLSFNPDIGLIGDFRSSYISKGTKNIDAYLNESELSVQSIVDPYIRADFFFSFTRNPDTHEYGVEVEEGYLTTLTLPGRLQLRAGKFRNALGRINSVHPHALPFIDMPNAFVNYFGADGLNDEGLSLSWLLPTKSVYQELVFQATAGFTESPVFARSDGNRLLYLGHLKNFFTINDNSTLEFGLTGITGPNTSSSFTNVGAADLTFKWKPVRLNTYRSLTWQSEFFYSNINAEHHTDYNSIGLYSFLQYQIAKRWFLTGRYDYAQNPYYNKIVEQAFSLNAGWLATEFQKIEVEVKRTDNNIRQGYFQVWLRWIFILGAHGAHQY